ncbi:MAG: TetR/AcrR family transcriptional regulator [Polyangiaceae bacterium]|nr:TetR/AcrR family transcriptional regulator [Polyangiaceae bacterium]
MGSSLPSKPPRRTQSERREATIRKLLDAAADALIDEGYSGATVQVICNRAGVSQGALFRHFPTREALLVEVCNDIGARVLADYRRRFTASGGGDPLLVAMQLLREQCRSRVNQAFYELSIAARTNVELARAMKPAARAYYDHIEELARELLPDLARLLGPSFRTMVDTVVCTFDGEAIHRILFEDKDLDAERLVLLGGAIAALTQPIKAHKHGSDRSGSEQTRTNGRPHKTTPVNRRRT